MAILVPFLAACCSALVLLLLASFALSAGGKKKSKIDKKSGRAAPAPPPPPGSLGWPLLGELLEYASDSREFVRRHYKLYGPVFRSRVFFRETVFIGGCDAIDDFSAVEKLCSTSSLPATFVELHGPYSVLNLSGAALVSARANLAKALRAVKDEISVKAWRMAMEEVRALAGVSPVKEEGAAGGLQQESRRVALLPMAKRFALRLLASVFLGMDEGLPAEFEEVFEDFNSGLLALNPLDWGRHNAFGRGKIAKNRLIQFVLEQIPRADERASSTTGGVSSFLSVLADARDEEGNPWPDERRAMAGVLFVWGALYEVIALISNVLLRLSYEENASFQARLRDEVSAEPVFATKKEDASADDQASSTIQKADASLVYLDAICKESLRLDPPTGGGFRILSQDVEVAGYTLQKGCVVTVDPRITACMEEVFDQPLVFLPDRFLPEKTADGGEGEAGEAVMPKNAFLPGGMGQHTCLGIAMGRLISRIFLACFVANLNFRGDGPPSFTKLPFHIVKEDYHLVTTPR